MTIAGFLADLRARQVLVTADGDQLRCSAPAGVLTDDLLDAIRGRKAEILRHLGRQALIPRHEGTPPLSYAQERFWLLHQFHPDDNAYNIPLAIRLRGELDPAALRQAIGQVIRRHDVLRTRYVTRRGRPEPVVDPAAAPDLPLVDLTGLPEAEREATRRELTEAEARRPFDLASGPVLRSWLLRESRDEHVLLLTRHHIASDGWSLGPLLTELGALYEACRGGRPCPLPELSVRYGDFAAWQRAADHTRDLDRWGHLTDAPPTVDLLTSVDADAPQRPVEVRRAVLEPALVDRLREWAGRERVTLFSVLLTGYALVLSSLSGQRELVIGSPVAGRTRPELDGLIGCFVNMLPLRLDLSGHGTASELVRRANAVVRDGLAGQDVPFEKLVEAFRPERDLTENPLFQAAFAFQNTPAADVRLSDVEASVEPSASVAPKFPLTLTATDRAGALDLDLEFDPRRLVPDLAGEILRRLREVLLAGAAEPDITAARLRHRLALGEDAAPAVAVEETTLPRLVAEITAARPDAIAVSHNGHHLTYRALQERADRVAAALRARGVGPDTLVGLCVEPGVDLVVGALGILRSGGAYLPLDPTDPVDRMRAVAGDAGLRLVVTRGDVPAPPVERIDLGDLGDLDDAGGLGAPAHPGLAQPVPANLAYVIYTSGSTGRPKGVAVSHGNVTGLLAACRRALPVTDEPQVWALTHSAAFDFSVWEMWGALTSGGRLVIVPPDVLRKPDELWELLRAERVAVLGQTPSACRHLLPAALADDPRRAALALVVLGGESCEVATLGPWFEAMDHSGPELVNMYGITETCVHVTVRPLRAADVDGAARSPIGGPLPGQRIAVVDQNGVRVPVGGQGELFVGGVGVARGYLGQPALTADRFRPDPARPGARGYRSGDLARALPDGELDYRGRLDKQVKLRGYRIEPGEVEAAALAHPSVRAGVVVPRTDGGRTYLAAYLVLADGTRDQHAAADAARAELRAFLAERLPRHMVPAAFVFVDRIPLTRNGKLDEAALPEPSAGHRPVSRPPQTPTEWRIAGILAEVLGLGGPENVGAQDNFFDLGGDSLLLIQFHSRVVAAFDIDLPVRQVYQVLDVATLASTVETFRARADEEALRAALAVVEAAELPGDPTAPESVEGDQ
uniref:TlmVII n=1 Tax=Streptoalloteichus hindustanus TaxID=2017 RepID=A4KUB1_STRHI|nr:TlmVII [Streptoalloteichus hindustanus]